jgi:hypothetical protein
VEITGSNPVAGTTFCEAIRRRQLLRIVYDGRERLVEPHCHGHGREGGELVLVHQRDGESRSGQATGWKLLAVNKVERAEATGLSFLAARQDYRSPPPGVARVHCEL